jgi:hypothetical protein
MRVEGTEADQDDDEGKTDEEPEHGLALPLLGGLPALGEEDEQPGREAHNDDGDSDR